MVSRSPVTRGPSPDTPRDVGSLLDAIAEIPDPEIPVITIADLGVLRDVTVEGDRATVTITPTYSGCPAMDQIADDIAAVVEAHGLAAEIVTTYSPAWTTDWMSEDARRRLNEFGIAPPTDRVLCPQCASETTHEVSRFGSTACKALWVCDGCSEPFDLFKVHAP